MNVLPAIDIRNGNSVRLKKGNFNDIKIYNISPLDQAKLFKDHGFDFIHIVDISVITICKIIIAITFII